MPTPFFAFETIHRKAFITFLLMDHDPLAQIFTVFSLHLFAISKNLSMPLSRCCHNCLRRKK